jgi:hypothetical protein
VVAGSNPARSVIISFNEFLELSSELRIRPSLFSAPFHLLPFFFRKDIFHNENLKIVVGQRVFHFEPIPTWKPTVHLNKSHDPQWVPITSLYRVYWENRPSRNSFKDEAKIYASGMLGYAFCLIGRIIRFVGRLFILLRACILAVRSGDWKTSRNRAVVSGISLGKIFSAIVGILCPLAAHRIDKELEKRMPESDKTLCLMVYDPIFIAYKILDLPYGTPFQEVREQYHQFARRFHPDKKGDTLKFQVVAQAYNQLKDYLSE